MRFSEGATRGSHSRNFGMILVNSSRRHRFIQNKWLLEQELASRDSNIGDLHWPLFALFIHKLFLSHSCWESSCQELAISGPIFEESSKNTASNASHAR